MKYVALLRGINVGGKNTVPMAKLKACVGELGFSSVRTYINSGNVIFDTPRTSPRKLEAAIEKGLKTEFGIPLRVVVRSLTEMAGVVQDMPKSWSKSKDARHYVLFLSHRIDRVSIIQTLQPRAGIDDALYRKGTVFWSTPFKDLTRSGLQKAIRLPVYQEMTIRNANTTRKLYELMAPDS